MSKYEFSVAVETAYDAGESRPEQDRYVFSYTVTVHNTGDIAAQLVARHWVIQDARGHTQEVKGLGVVGHQPLLQPGEAFRYTSGCHLQVASGTMHGSYFCVAEDGERFEAPVAPFVLDASGTEPVPRILH